MAKVLKRPGAELDNLLAITNRIKPSKMTNGRKHAEFRRAIKLALKDYLAEQDKFLKIYRDDYSELQKKEQGMTATVAQAKDKKVKAKTEKELVELKKAMQDLVKESNDAVAKYQKENNQDIAVKFNEETYSYMTNCLSESISDIYAMQIHDKDGKVQQESIDHNLVDALFEVLDSAK